MTEQKSQTDFRLADPAQFARNMAKVFEQAAQIAQQLAEPARCRQARYRSPGHARRSGREDAGRRRAVLRVRSAEADGSADAALGGLWRALADQPGARCWARTVTPVATPERGDRRFNDKDWQENTVFDFLKQFYLISARWARRSGEERRRHRRSHAPQGALLCRADRQCAVALQLRLHQSGSAARDARHATAPISSRV